MGKVRAYILGRVMYYTYYILLQTLNDKACKYKEKARLRTISVSYTSFRMTEPTVNASPSKDAMFLTVQAAVAPVLTENHPKLLQDQSS